MDLRGRKLGMLLSTDPRHPNVETGLGVARAALDRGVDLYLYLVDDGVRNIEDVINGYENTGVFRSENWLIVHGDGKDVGVLLLADHPKAGHFELMYMGLVPEARGRGWGRQIAEHAQRMVRRAGAARIVAAVDAANTPALRMYQMAGFDIWDRRTVYVRFSAGART